MFRTSILRDSGQSLQVWMSILFVSNKNPCSKNYCCKHRRRRLGGRGGGAVPPNFCRCKNSGKFRANFEQTSGKFGQNSGEIRANSSVFFCCWKKCTSPPPPPAGGDSGKTDLKCVCPPPPARNKLVPYAYGCKVCFTSAYAFSRRLICEFSVTPPPPLLKPSVKLVTLGTIMNLFLI